MLNNEQPRLLFLEGLPGTGKSTNSRIITAQLESIGRKVKWIHEVARPHPTLYFDEACFLLEEYDEFVEKHPNAKSTLDKVMIKRRNTISIDLLEVQWKYLTEIGLSAFEELQSFHVWNFSLEKYMNIAIEKWEFFVHSVKQQNDVTYILDSSIFQFQIYTFLEKNTPIEILKTFISKIFSFVSELNPRLIYLFRENVENSLVYLEKTRGLQFLEDIWKRDCHQPYYQNRQTGAEGYREFLRDYHYIAKELYKMVPFEKLAIDITNEDWERNNSEIRRFLNFREHETITKANDYIGIFSNEDLNLHIDVRGEYIIDPAGSTKKIYPRSVNEFYVEDLPVILHFNSEDTLTIMGEQLIARWTTNGLRYRKMKETNVD